ncbi:retrovirus-related pol polyprotein from transposon TNT 1-94, partial [Tanacetum coccineum]
STQDVNTAKPSINTTRENINTGSSNINTASPIPNDPSMQYLEATSIFDDAYDDKEEVAPLTRRMSQQNLEELGLVSYIKKQRTQKVIPALQDPIWIEAMQDELLQFSLQKVWRLVDLPKGKHAIGTKWVYRNKKDERGIVVRNKARLIAQAPIEVSWNHDAIPYGKAIKVYEAKFKSHKAHSSNFRMWAFVSLDDTCSNNEAVNSDHDVLLPRSKGKSLFLTLLMMSCIMDIRGIEMGDAPRRIVQDQGIFDSRCSRHMTGNKSYLTDYQDIDGGFVALQESTIGVAERKNMTLIEAARTMLADSLLPTIFWTEAVNTACYVQNRVLMTKPHNKTPYELLLGRPPSISFMRPFGCTVTILNTLDLLGKFDGKVDEGFLVRYFINSKAFRVFNTRTRKVEENLHINFLENKPNVVGSGPEWLFDIDSLAKSMNYEPVTKGNQTNGDAGFDNADDLERIDSSTQDVNTARPSINTTRENINTGSSNINTASPIPNDPSMQYLEATSIFDDAYDDKEEVGA